MEIIYPWWEITEVDKKPEAPSWLIDNIAELTKNTRTLHMIYVGFLVYCALTVVSTSDRKIILDEQAHLPLAGIDVPFTAFVVLAPIIAIIVFLYFQLHLQALNDATVNLRRKYAPVETGRLYPWMISSANQPERGAMGMLQRVVAKLSLWWLVPATLILIATWTLKKQNQSLSYFEWTMSGVGVLLVLWLWHRHDSLPSEVGGHRGLAGRLGSYALRHWDIISFAIIVLAVYTAIVYSVFLGQSGTSRCWYCVDLSNEILVTEQKEEYSLYWLNLSHARLDRANLAYTVLKRANLEHASLVGANLSGANLRGANLKWTDLRKATFVATNLEDADLTKANLPQTGIFGSNLQKAKLYDANLRCGSIRESQLPGADLTFADLTGSFLSEVNLKGADLKYAILEGAHLYKVDLRWATGLTAEKLSTLSSLVDSQLDPPLMEAILRDYPQLLSFDSILAVGPPPLRPRVRSFDECIDRR